MTQARSWGRAHPGLVATERHARSRHDVDRVFAEARRTGARITPFGMGRSYGDSCLSDQGVLLHLTGLDCLVEFDRKRGTLRAEAGITLDEILQLIVPHGWFLPVTPGTKFVTLGGAVANDVHGKNHHRAGSLGGHVRAIGLMRSDGSRLTLSAEENAELFAATIGGLGLTGIMEWVEIALAPIRSAYLNCEQTPFRTLREFIDLSRSLSDRYDHVVAWIDGVNRPDGEVPGIVFHANFELHPGELRTHGRAAGFKRVPFELPFSLINRETTGLFNRCYRRWPRRPRRRHYDPFFYPLDGIGDWNRLYGKNGLYQYQCVMPDALAEAGMTRLLEAIAASGQGSFLSVLKVLGEARSPGLMSFPREGITLAMDFPNRGRATRRLLDEFDEIVLDHQGAIYPAKDGRVGGHAFRRMYPQWERFSGFVDPLLGSAFWDRVMRC